MQQPKTTPEPINEQVRYYQILLQLERTRKAFIIRWLKKNHNDVHKALLLAIDAEKDRRYRVTMRKFDLFLK